MPPLTRRTPAALVVLTALAGLGCAQSVSLDVPADGAAGATGAVGAAGTSGSAGSPGTVGAGGASGGTGAAGIGASGAAGVGVTGAAGVGVTGAAGRGGSSGGPGTGFGGIAGRGGSSGGAGSGGTGRAGTTGRGGTNGAAGTFGTAGAGGATNADGGAVTFTDVYAEVISNNCFGSACHNPAGGDRPSFATQSGCYSFFKNQGQLYPGQDPMRSYIYFIMHGDPTASPPSPPYMPPTPNPNVSADDLAIVAAWIADGALDN